MKNKIVLSLCVLFLFFVLGASYALIHITNTTEEVKRIIEMHEVEELRRSLIINIQTVQSSLLTFNTPYESDLDVIVDNVSRLDESAQQCTTCHHHPRVTERILNIQASIEEYQDNLSYFMTMSANLERISQYKHEAVEIGNRLIAQAVEMSHGATDVLKAATHDTVIVINHVKEILLTTILVTLMFSILVAVQLIRSVTRPVNALVRATRKISSGEYGTTINYRDKTEFGELAENFNVMSMVVKKGYDAIQKEVTERKRTEEALVSSEKFLNTIFDSILDPFRIIDRDYIIVRVNEAYAAIKNKVAADMIGVKCYEIIENRSSRCDDCIVTKTFETMSSHSKDKKIVSADGERIWLDIYTYPIFNEEGNITHVIEYIRDITDRQLAEEAVRISEERYMLSARGANDGLWDWNIVSNVIYYSPRWKAMLGYEEAEIMNTPDAWMERIHPDDRMHVETEIEAHINGHTPHFKNEHRIRHKDNTYRWVLSRGLAIRDESGTAYRMAGSMTDVTERRVAEEQLMFDALHDVLTRLPNRALFMDRLGLAVNREKRNKASLFAVCFIDIDRFKVFNDSLGHGAGDSLLIAIAERLAESLRPDDTIARLGGDEFAILLEDLKDSNEAVHIINRIQEKFAQSFDIEGEEVFTSASIGVTFSSGGYNDPEHLLRDADIAMHHAKSKGSAQYQVFDENMLDNAVTQLQLETDLRQAVKQRDFCLYYQPIISAGTGRITGLEALIRWNHPRKGIIFPGDFIPIVEETGLIIQLGDWIIEEACTQLGKWQKQFTTEGPLTVSVNISSKQLMPSLVSYVEEVLHRTDISPRSLILEITESMIMEKAETVAPLLMKLKAMGVQLHIDDFGTGYSSLSYLHQYPLDVLKIDRSFVRRIGANGDNMEIITAIITLAHSLQMDIVAEGVETEDQFRLLKALGCEYMQGYYFSKPLPFSEIEFLLKKSHLNLMAYLTHPSKN